MICFAAHTGARRSELLRVEIHDLDFESGTVLIREKKGAKGTRTTRRVPLSDLLQNTLRDWLAIHPGGPMLFVQQQIVPHSRTVRSSTTPVTPDEAQNAIRQFLNRGKWKVIRGWHIFRPSFCSNCAAQSVDQRLINAWVGHQTEEMVKRYRHLNPHQERAALAAVFGNAE